MHHSEQQRHYIYEGEFALPALSFLHKNITHSGKKYGYCNKKFGKAAFYANHIKSAQYQGGTMADGEGGYKNEYFLIVFKLVAEAKRCYKQDVIQRLPG